MKLQIIHQSLLEMGKPAQVCPKCGHSPIHKTHNYYKGEWKCKNAPLPGFPQGSQSGASAPAATPAPSPAAAPRPTPAPTAAPAPVARPATPTATPRVITPSGGPKVTVQPSATAAPTAVPSANREHDIKVFLAQHKVTDYVVNPDGTIDINQDEADFTGMGTKKMLPVRLNKVAGELHIAGYVETLRNCPVEVGDDFDCTVTAITNLQGFPKTVGGDVSLVGNEKLTSLEGMDGVVIGGDFECTDSRKLESLENIHKRIAQVNGTIKFTGCGIKRNVLGLLRIRGVKKVILPDAKVTEILNKHLENGNPDVYAAQEELLDAGFDDFAEL